MPCWRGRRRARGLERALVVLARASADERVVHLAVGEDDRGRDREDAVARGDERVLIDVDLGELDFPAGV
jgi:hypothetical protein